MVNRTNFGIYLKTERGDLIPQSYDGIVYVKHNEEFGIVIENRSNVRIKAQCFVSGENMGVLIIRAGQREVLKRPIIGLDRPFKYGEFGSETSFHGKLDPHKLHIDEITVIIKPETKKKDETDFSKPVSSNNFGIAGTTESLKIKCDGTPPTGGVVLGSKNTNQKFVLAPYFCTKGEYQFTIVLRSLGLSRKAVLPLTESMEY